MVWNKVIWSTLKVDFPTPDYIFKLLDDEFHFDLDAAASAENTKCAKFITEDEDALILPDWPGSRIFLNPPYSKMLGRWIQKACEQSRRGKTVVCLVPARVDTKWFHKYCIPPAEVLFLDHRLSFNNENKAPFPSMVVIFRPAQT
jgi:site-specific DNA-methyltransferase (adenine-specific)